MQRFVFMICWDFSSCLWLLDKDFSKCNWTQIAVPFWQNILEHNNNNWYSTKRFIHYSFKIPLQWGKKVFSQPPIVQVLPLKKMREACNFHHRYTSTMRDKIRKKKIRKSHCRISKEFICKLWWKISIWSPTNKQDCWLSQTCNFFFKRLLCPPLVTCINGICLNSLSV